MFTRVALSERKAAYHWGLWQLPPAYGREPLKCGAPDLDVAPAPFCLTRNVRRASAS